MTLMAGPMRTRALVVAFLLAMAAGWAFSGVDRRPGAQNTVRFAAACALLAASVAAAAFARVGRSERVPAARPPQPRLSRARLALGALALLSYAGAVVVYLARGDTPVVGPLWLASVVFLLAAAFRRGAGEELRRGDWLLVAGLTGLAFLLRHLRLTELPSDLDNDFALAGLNTLDLLARPRLPIVGNGFGGEPLLHYAVFGASMRIFGENLYGLAMNSVLFGTLCVPLVFLLGRELFGRRAGLVAAALLTISVTHSTIAASVIALSTVGHTKYSIRARKLGNTSQ